MTCFLLELITLKKQDKNSKGKNLSEQGKQNVLKEFKKQFSVTINWNKVKNRLYILKKQYEYYPYSKASKLRSHPLCFIPLLNMVFRDETVVVEVSWQPRRGVHHRTPQVELSDEEEVQIQNDSHDLDHIEQEDTDCMKDISHRKHKRNTMDSTLDRIAATMEDQNGILEQMASSTSKTKSTNANEEHSALVVKCVRGVHDLTPMIELYQASLDLIATNDIVRGLFMACPDDEKLPF
ncbi:hypothetical protein N665_0273s0013 [Sinapis alba]|nr:hypothetical protein N665_0273s0013 [Sinapis alba]